MNFEGKWRMLLSLPAMFLLAAGAGGQSNGKPSIEGNLRAAIAVQQNLPSSQQNLFSGALKNYLALAHGLLDPRPANPGDDARTRNQSASRPRAGAPVLSAAHSDDFAHGEGREGEVAISSTAGELQATRLTGFTQSTTSTAWCGHNIITGFDSTEAAVQTFLIPNFNGLSTAGSATDYAVSTNDGESFTDAGFLNPGPFPNFITGNPVLACANSQKFFLATSPFSTLINLSPDGFTGTPVNGVALSISNDAGKHFADPVMPVSKGIFHLIDKAWVAIDPENPQHIYVSYTDFDADGFFPQFVPNPRCPGVSRSAIELVSSVDGGQTWSAPSIVREVCHTISNAPGNPILGPSFTGSQVAIGRGGKVYVSYLQEDTDSGLPALTMQFRASADHGATFGPEVKVADVVQTGCCAFVDGLVGIFQGFLQGFFQVIDYPSMAVGHHGKHDVIYLVWADGRDKSTIDVVVAGSNTYNFSDIVLSKSTDGGNTWTQPEAVSPTPRDFAGAGRDQFHPGIAVNEDGKIAVCYNDRRNDPANNLVDHFCSLSSDGGNNFHDVRQTSQSWIPVHFSESGTFTSSVYMGDYDTVAAHQGGHGEDADEFFNAFQEIHNVVVTVHGRSAGREQ
jgi:hypothetical protein